MCAFLEVQARGRVRRLCVCLWLCLWSLCHGVSELSSFSSELESVTLTCPSFTLTSSENNIISFLEYWVTVVWLKVVSFHLLGKILPTLHVFCIQSKRWTYVSMFEFSWMMFFLLVHCRVSGSEWSGWRSRSVTGRTDGRKLSVTQFLEWLSESHWQFDFRQLLHFFCGSCLTRRSDPCKG